MRCAIIIAAVAVLLVIALPRAAARTAVHYQPPVSGRVTDPFRAPSSEYGAGNRGIDYATLAGEAVRAAAGGVVVFAGQVGGSLHVVVLHDDGIRTSYSFLQSISLARGNHVAAGDVVGTSADSLHFGARAGDAYLDPAVLLESDGSVRLVPDGTAEDAAKPESESAERDGLAQLVWGGVVDGARATGHGAARLAAASAAVASHAPPIEQVRAAIEELQSWHGGDYQPFLPGESGIRDAIAVANRIAAREPCTPAEAPAPAAPQPRHMVVLVGGLGSSSETASVYDVDTAALGYAPDDVVRFSYRGGTTQERPYDPADTTADLRRSGRRLRQLLDRMQYEHPGVPVDIIAHSQGGLVARSALGDELDPYDPRVPRIGTLITLGSPHRGADLATAAAWLRYSARGQAVRHVIAAGGRKRGIDPTSKSIGQMAETSDYLRKLNRRPLPKGLHAFSIAARRDVVVPSPRSRLRGAHNLVVTVPGLGNDHARLPGSAAAQREMALALAGMPATCESAADMATDALTGHAIDAAEKAGAVGAAMERP